MACEIPNAQVALTSFVLGIGMLLGIVVTTCARKPRSSKSVSADTGCGAVRLPPASSDNALAQPPTFRNCNRRPSTESCSRQVESIAPSLSTECSKAPSTLTGPPTDAHSAFPPTTDAQPTTAAGAMAGETVFQMNPVQVTDGGGAAPVNSMHTRMIRQRIRTSNKKPQQQRCICPPKVRQSQVRVAPTAQPIEDIVKRDAARRDGSD